MSIATLNGRLRKMEASRPALSAPAMLLAWGRTVDDLRAALAPFRAHLPADRLAGALWPYADPPPAPRLTSDQEADVRELEALLDQLRRHDGDQDDRAGTSAAAQRAVLAMSDAALMSLILTSPAFQDETRSLTV